MTMESHEEYSEKLALLAAELLVASRLAGRQFSSLPVQVRPRTVEDGYLVQRVARDVLSHSGFGRHGGWKIGCTTSVMQEFLGVESPVSGAMFRHSMWHGQHRFAVAPPCVLGVECEIAVRLGDDLPGGGQPYSTGDVADAVSAVMAAIEVVQDRYIDYRALDIPTLVADDFFHYGCVLGVEDESRDPHELGDATASMSINGVDVGHGRGSDILGHPLVALAWLVNNCAVLGTPVLAGDIVLLGSVVQTQWVDSGDVVVVHNDMLGDVSASFSTR